MYDVRDSVQARVGNFRMDRYWFRYSNFIPRLYNWVLDLGFEKGKIMPSRAFCSDESQGFPIILLAKHFGAFPFNHGQVGGIISCDRHGSHSHHGKDLVILHASHVGYDHSTKAYGHYRRIHHEGLGFSSNCGKIFSILDWYIKEYEFAKNNILIDMRPDHCLITIDNQYLSLSYNQNLMLLLEKMIEQHKEDENAPGEYIPISIQSTSRTFMGTSSLYKHMSWFFKPNSGKLPIGDALLPEYFTYKKQIQADYEGHYQLERNLLRAMPWIVTSSNPMLTAAQTNTQVEFDRGFRSISQEPAYKGRNLLYISGLNVDISPEKNQKYFLNKFIPWAVYVQLNSGEKYILEQIELHETLHKYSVENPDQVKLDEVIKRMQEADPIDLEVR